MRKTINLINMNPKVKNTFLFFLLAFVALALIITCSGAFTLAYETSAAMYAICGVVSLLFGGFSVYKFTKKIMEDLR